MPGWPAGGPGKGPWVFYNVTEDFAFWPTLESIGISELHPDGIMPMSCEVEDRDATLVFDHDDEVYASFDGTKVWAGHIKIPGNGQMSEHGPRVWQLTGQDFTAKLDDSVIGKAKARPRETLAGRVAWILTKLNYSITTSAVSLPSENIDADSYEGMTVREALQRVSDEKGLHFYVDFEKDLHMFRSEVISAPFALDDTSPDYATSFPYSEFALPTDSVELTNAVRVKGARVARWVKDSASIAAYGRQESIIVDDSLATTAQVIAAGERRLNQLDEPIVDGSLVCWQPGLRAGMRFTLTNDRWDISTEPYIITQVDISAAGPHDQSGDAMLRSEVRFTDRRRVGRFPGSGKPAKDANKPGKPGSGGTIGGCCEPVPAADPKPLAEFGGGGLSGTGDTDISSGTTHIIDVAPGAEVIGNVLLIFLAQTNFPTEDVPAIIEAMGYDILAQDAWPSPDYGTAILSRVIDGSEGFTGSGDTLEFMTSTSTVVATVTEALSGVFGNGTGDYWDASIALGSADPPSLGTTWDDTEPARWFAFCLSDGAAITGFPTGYTFDGSAGSASLDIALYRKDDDSATENPSTFTTSGPVVAWTVVIRGTPVSWLGVVPPGPYWEGGNPWVDESASPPSVAVVDGDLVITSDVAGSDLWHRAEGPPMLPTELDDWTMVLPFVLDEAGSLVDTGDRYLAVYATIDGQNIGWTVYLGDTTRAQGVAVSGASETFVAKDIVEGSGHYFKLRFSDGVAYVKLWLATDPEPDWDASTDVLAELDEADNVQIAVVLGNDGGTPQVLTLSPPLITGGALPGDVVDWHVVGYGDGSTTTFETLYPFKANTLQVRVDKQGIPSSGFASVTPADGEFDLTRAPYGDPVDSTGSSVVEARYTRA